MAKKIAVVFSETARQDLREILEFLQVESSGAHRKMVRKIYDRLQKIPVFPKAGRMIPEIREPTLREILIGPYRLMYRLEENKVVVLRIFHGKRLFPEDL